ncbi:unnamed protein product [Closterium sp. Yama58-4]|nr:unnamed protein product [Closterium sp. Yama58-4]
MRETPWSRPSQPCLLEFSNPQTEENMAALTTSSQVATAVARVAASASASSSQPASSLSQSSSSRIAASSPLRLAASSRRASIQRRHAVATDRLVQGDKAEGKVKAEQIKVEEEAAEITRDDVPVPSAFEIQSLLMELCDETKIAELRIKIGNMELHVRRDVGGVGIMRRGRQVKGKKGRPMVTEGSEIKKGQVVCYLEQLGTQLAIESENAGEVVKFLVEDGDAVGYGDQLIAIRPSFPGIKKLAL